VRKYESIKQTLLQGVREAVEYASEYKESWQDIFGYKIHEIKVPSCFKIKDDLGGNDQVQTDKR